MSQQRPIIATSFSYETLEEKLDIKPQGAQLHIGIPRETAFQENRIALTPDAVGVLISNGHDVVIEHNAGEAAHFRDRDYAEAGARIVYDKGEVFKAPILVKSAPDRGRGYSLSPVQPGDHFSHPSFRDESGTAAEDDGQTHYRHLLRESQR